MTESVVQVSYATLGTFLVYLLAMLAIGIYAYTRTKNSNDYFLGGRTLGPWPAALSAGASDMSGWLLLGLPGAAYISGVSAFWIALGLLSGTWLNWLLQAKRLRTYSIEAYDALTLPEYLSRRFFDKSGILQVVSAVVILFFFLFYTASGLVAGGKLFETVFGIDGRYAMVVGALCVVSYTLFGGFLAVAWTDLVQGLMMAAALLIVPVVALDGGNLMHLPEQLNAINPDLTNFLNDNGKEMGAMAIFSSLAWGLGYFGQPHILARFKASRSNKDLTTARRIAVGWTGISLCGAMLVGLVGLVYIGNHAELAIADGKHETIFMVLVNALFHPVMAGVLLAAILAAVMSTADSQLLVASSALAEDFYKQLFRKQAGNKELMLVGRLSVIGIALGALALGMCLEQSVMEFVSYAWAGFGAAFGPAILLSLYWSRMTRNGAVAGIVVGGVTVVVWKLLTGGIFDLYEIVPGFIFAVLAIVGVSLLDKKPSEAMSAQFARVEARLKTDP
ncbi:Sodium/proline symporter [Vibrio stylophorae]|uniref:Sodium/proline symporter n=1 Tax=Vibrio stylophorae TaxID=659351 RepID=A0ABM8ZZ89_9VIBR|nr:sodium/proline symporter PutP [Vibrio stylophorae]CAH0535798.1 Sodium/proline symporter [Vibrio stylophorae]